MATYHVLFKQSDGQDVNELYFKNKAKDVIIDPNDYSSIPSTNTDLNKVLENIGDLAFESSVGVNKQTGSEYAYLTVSDSPTVDPLDSDTVASTTALSIGLNGKVSTSGAETVGGVKSFTDGIDISGINIRYDSTTETLTFS